MKKLSLLVSTLGGAMGGYVLSNKKLRDQLANAKDAEAAAKLLGKHLQKDGKKLAKQVREFVESDEVQENLGKAKKYTKQKADEAAGELKKMVDANAKKATKTVKKKVAATKKKVAKKSPAAKKKAAKPKRRVTAKTKKV